MKQKIRFGGLLLKFRKKIQTTKSSFVPKKKVADKVVTVLLLNELIDSDNEKPKREKMREWIQRGKENGYFNNISQGFLQENM